MSTANNPIVIIQARIGSSRFPGKTMHSINGMPLIGWLIEGARKLVNANGVAVAVPDLPEDDVLDGYVQSLGVPCVRGPVDDVLARYHLAATALKADPVIRLCADSPLVAADFMELMIESHIETAADLTNGIRYPLGSVGEVVSYRALEEMHRKATAPYCREHVTPYIQEHSGEFKINTLMPPVWMQRDFRLTVDTPADMEMMARLFDELGKAGLAVNFTNAMAMLDVKPEIAQINAAVRQRDWRAESPVFGKR